MINIHDKSHCPTPEEFGAYIQNPVFLRFLSDITETFQCREKPEFSSCSWEPGWNIKFRKSGKNLCTIYPREGYFTVLIVIGRKEKESAEAILDQCTPRLQEIYASTRQANGQRWLMIDLKGQDGLYADTMRLLAIRKG